jgi:hypothetical protein
MIPVRMFKTYNVCHITMMIPVRMFKTYNVCYITMMIPVCGNGAQQEIIEITGLGTSRITPSVCRYLTHLFFHP